MHQRFRIFLLLLCLFSTRYPAQADPVGIRFSIDSTFGALTLKPVWRISLHDIPNGADTLLDDSGWPLVNPELRVKDDTAAGGFRGFAWLRLHLYLDSTLAHQPLALLMQHDGASQIYFDGRLINEYGTVAPADSIEYYNPQSVPFVLPEAGAGWHLLAVRYVNRPWLTNYRRYSATAAGIRPSLRRANSAIEVTRDNTFWGATILMTFMGVFMALAMVHLVLFLFYRAERSNILFSLFAFCMGCSFLIPSYINFDFDPATALHASYAVLFSLTGTFSFLSALVSQIFSKRRWPGLLMLGLSVITIVLLIIDMSTGGIAMIFFTISVLVQVFVNVIVGMWRRMPGARILGAGILLFVVMLLSLIVATYFNNGLHIEGTGTAGQVMLALMALGMIAIPASMSAFLAWRFATISKHLKHQLVQVEALSVRAREQEAERQRLLESRQEELEQQVAERTASLRSEKQKSDDLLLNILPEEVAEELKQTGASAARLYNEVSVLFTDFVDFTQMAERLSPAALVAEIHDCFKAFDGIVEKHGLEKIKTVGDAYIAVSGLPAPNSDHAATVVKAALEIRDYMLQRARTHDATFRIRLGVHSGPVVAGIVGVKKFAYDIWGDTVNTAARMEQSSEAGRLNISAATYELIKERFNTTYRGELEAKHKGKLNMYFVETEVPSS